MRIGFEREIVGSIWKLAWPTVVYSLLQAMVGIADLYMVKGLGPAALSAVGITRQITMLVVVAILAVTTGTVTLVAQFTGVHRHEEAGETARQALMMMVLMGVVIAVVGVWLSGHVFSAMGTEEAVSRHGKPYMRLLLAGMVFTMINFTVAAAMRGAGDALTPLKIALVVNVLNVLGNYLFIFGPGPFPRLGVPGAAIGTLIGRFTGAMIGVWLLTWGGSVLRCNWKRGFKPDFALIRKMLRVGLPSAVQGIFRNGAYVLFFGIVAASTAGTVAVAALTVGVHVRMFSVMTALAFQVAAASLVGQHIGAGRVARAEQFGWQTVKLCGLLMAGSGIVMWLGSSTLGTLFSKNEDVAAMTATVLRFFAVSQFLTAIAISASGALLGAGDTKPAMFSTILARWVIMLPLAYLLVSRTSLDVNGAWLAWMIAPAIQAGWLLTRFAGGKWKSIRLLK